MAELPFFKKRVLTSGHGRTADKREEKKPRVAWWRHPWFWRIGAVLGVLTLVSSVSAAVYILFFSGMLTIDFVDVKHDEGVDATRVRGIIFTQMEQNRFNILPQRVLPFFDEEEARKKIWSEYALDMLVIEKQYPRTLSIEIKGTPFAVAWLGEGDQWYHLDAKGHAARAVDSKLLAPVAAKLPTTDRFDVLVGDKKGKSEKKESEKGQIEGVMPLIMDTERKLVAVNDVVATQAKVSFTVLLPEKLKGIGVTPLYYKTTRSSADIRAVTTEGWEILFNPQAEIDDQVRYLDIVLREKVKTDRPKLQYVDVRFENRIYFKL